MSKGSKRRPGNTAAYRDNYDAIYTKRGPVGSGAPYAKRLLEGNKLTDAERHFVQLFYAGASPATLQQALQRRP